MFDSLNQSICKISSDSHLLPMLNTPFEGIISINTEGQIVFVSTYFLELLQVSFEQIIGKNINSVLPQSRLSDTLRKGYSEWGDTLEIDGRKIYVARFPLKIGDKLVGAMLKTVFPDLMIGRSIADRITFIAQSKMANCSQKKLFTCMDIIGESEPMLLVKKLARKASRTTSTLLITGESGTGKEVIAQAIHSRSVRRDSPYVSVNCGAIPKDLLESELFGYVPGSFTGAHPKGSPGKFVLADGGTLLLDEIGEMSLDMQVKLLRVLQEKEVWPIGGTSPTKFDVRIIATTNRDLREMIKEGTFRQDLYYRLHILSIHMPPLRDRLEDIPDLCEALIQRVNARLGTAATGISEESLAIAQNYSWPGNVRELENVIEQAIHYSYDPMVNFNLIVNPSWEEEFVVPPFIEKRTQSYEQEMLHKELELIEKVLAEVGGNKSKAAKVLGISRSAFYRKLERHCL